MEAFSLLKYWRGGGGATAISAAVSARPAVSITTISTSALPSAEETDDESGDGDDEGPFFDLEFTVPDEECEGDGNEEGEDDDAASSRDGEEREEVTDDEGAAEEREFNFTLSSEGSCGDVRGDPGLPLSPSDDLFFKGRLVPLESSSLVFNHAEAHAKSHMLPVSLLRTKFRVLMLGLRRPKHASAAGPAGEPLNGAVPAALPSPKHPHQQRQNKLFTVKFKVEEVPIVSLFTRDNSSRSTGSSSGRAPKQQADECNASAASVGEKKLSKELVHKYLSKIKPLYVRVSKRYTEKLRFSGQLSAEGVISKEPPAQATTSSRAASSGEAEVKDGEPESAQAAAAPSSAAGTTKAVPKPAQLGNLPAGLRVVCKHLGKSRSASAAVAAAAVPSPPPTVTRRRDDSLLQQQDGIQSAIAHCKMSFNGSKEVDSSLLLSQSEIDASRTCCEKVREDCV